MNEARAKMEISKFKLSLLSSLPVSTGRGSNRKDPRPSHKIVPCLDPEGEFLAS
jgi:hypothetical protein